MVKDVDVFFTDKVVVTETAAESLWDVHKFVNYCFVLVFSGKFFEGFEEFYSVESLCVHRMLHEFTEGVAAGDGAFGTGTAGAEASNSFESDVIHIECIDYVIHSLLQVVGVFVFHGIEFLREEGRVFRLYCDAMLKLATAYVEIDDGRVICLKLL